ncbi:Ctf8-domain-containing protein [Fomitopsis betulina]|nr:Ctf8-domain-containing protein [Fomitopsis betulina]
MIIPVNISLSSSPTVASFSPQLSQFGSEGLVLIELQGKLEVAGENDGEVIGTLNIDEATKKSTLLIGHHLLEGKLVNLQKPLAVLQKRSDLSGVSADAGALSRSPQGVSWDMIAVVKRKMVFSKRPMPMVGKAASSAPVSRGGTK